MTPQEWLEHEGEKADIVGGDPVLSEGGFLTVSSSPAMYSLYVDKWAGTATPIVPAFDYRARPYKFKLNDCVTLAARWYDTEFGADLLSRVKAISRREYMELNASGFGHVIESLGFFEVQDRADGDLLVYGQGMHLGVQVGADRILHHLPDKYSCIDTIDPSLVLKVYRYAR